MENGKTIDEAQIRVLIEDRIQDILSFDIVIRCSTARIRFVKKTRGGVLMGQSALRFEI